MNSRFLINSSLLIKLQDSDFWRATTQFPLVIRLFYVGITAFVCKMQCHKIFQLYFFSSITFSQTKMNLPTFAHSQIYSQFPVLSPSVFSWTVLHLVQRVYPCKYFSKIIKISNKSQCSAWLIAVTAQPSA